MHYDPVALVNVMRRPFEGIKYSIHNSHLKLNTSMGKKLLFNKLIVKAKVYGVFNAILNDKKHLNFPIVALTFPLA